MYKSVTREQPGLWSQVGWAISYGSLVLSYLFDLAVGSPQQQTLRQGFPCQKSIWEVFRETQLLVGL